MLKGENIYTHRVDLHVYVSCYVYVDVLILFCSTLYENGIGKMNIFCCDEFSIFLHFIRRYPQVYTSHFKKI